MSQDLMGNRMKRYESAEAGRRFMPMLPVCVRLDGRSFSRWTKGLERPFDERFHNIMVNTAIGLVEETNARVGYTQSDEISLILHSDDPKSQIYFDGKIQKVISSISGMAAALFALWTDKYLPNRINVLADPKRIATFDCRAWNVPNKEEAVNAILWREFDATKNSIQQAAHHHYSHKQLMNKHTGEMQEMLFQKGINWNDYPDWCKRGTYVQRKAIERRYSVEEMEKLPPKHQARQNPRLTVLRHDVVKMEMPSLAKVMNRVDVLFHGAEPLVQTLTGRIVDQSRVLGYSMGVRVD